METLNIFYPHNLKTKFKQSNIRCLHYFVPHLICLLLLRSKNVLESIIEIFFTFFPSLWETNMEPLPQTDVQGEGIVFVYDCSSIKSFNELVFHKIEAVLQQISKKPGPFPLLLLANKSDKKKKVPPKVMFS